MSGTVITIAVMSATVNSEYNWLMVRWEPDSRGRLAQAALVLYAEQGFDQTTVAEIAERAGLTERTFFRHFTDKKEVLFGGAQALLELFVTSVLEAPVSATPLEAVTLALEAAGERFNGNRDFSVQRQRIIEGSTELQERELIKLASLAAALADALRQRGLSDPTAGLMGEVAIAIFKISFERWVSPFESRDLTQLMRDALDELRSVTEMTR
jgi:AcrR family transcriptional regulator